MQVVKYGLVFILIFYFSFLLLSPKRELYHLLEKEIYKSGIIIDGEDLEETQIGVKLIHPSIIYQGAKIADAKEIKIVTMIFYSRITIEGIEDDSGMRNLFPLMPTAVVISYSVIDPGRLNITVFGDFGKAEGYYDLNSNILHLNLNQDADIASIKRYLKKSGNGWYYEERF